MNKKVCLVTNILLIIWFFFDMFGFSVGNFNLVESAWDSIDGIWYLIYIGLFSLFYFNERYGKYPLTTFLSLWLIVQFLSHWYYTIFSASEKKITGYNNFFANTYHLIPASDKVIIPDLYHILLHLFIVVALVCMISYCVKNRSKKSSVSIR